MIKNCNLSKQLVTMFQRYRTFILYSFDFFTIIHTDCVKSLKTPMYLGLRRLFPLKWRDSRLHSSAVGGWIICHSCLLHASHVVGVRKWSAMKSWPLNSMTPVLSWRRNNNDMDKKSSRWHLKRIQNICHTKSGQPLFWPKLKRISLTPICQQ